MNLFAANLPTVRRLVEQLWREISRQAGEAALLDVKKARVEITIKVVPVKEVPKHYVDPATGVKYLRANTAAKLFADAPARERATKAVSIWKRLMGDD